MIARYIITFNKHSSTTRKYGIFSVIQEEEKWLDNVVISTQYEKSIIKLGVAFSFM